MKPDSLVAAIKLARFEPSRFARDVLQLKRLENEPKPGSENYNPDLDWELDAWQEELIESVADVHRKKVGLPTKFNHSGKQYITCRACQGPGKTFGIALLAHIWGFAYDPLVICTMAPKLEHVKTRFFGEFEKIRSRGIEGYATLMEVGVQKIQWQTGSPVNHFLQAETGAQPENIQGLRRRFTLYLVDESSGMSEKMFPVMSGNINATELGIIVLIGNPTRLQGTFADSHLKPNFEKLFYRMYVGPDKSRRVKDADVQRLIGLYGENSDITRVRAFGLFPLSDSNQLLSLEWLEAARIRDSSPDGSIPKLRVTIDVADGGLAETVCSAAMHYSAKIVFLKETRHSFPAHVSPILAAKAGRSLFIEFGGSPNRGDDIVVDADGVGAGTAGWLMSEADAMIDGVPLNVIPYRGGHSSDNPKLYRNRRVQSYLVLRDRYRDGLVAYDENYTEDWDGLHGQLCMNRRKPGTERVEDLLSKLELVAMGLQSPDRADAQAMHMATQSPILTISKVHKVDEAKELVVIESSVLEGLF